MSKKTDKTLRIDPELHTKLKSYCDKEGLKMQPFVEKALKEAMKK
jgi:predicted HicB family RNase H-like nuclease